MTFNYRPQLPRNS